MGGGRVIRREGERERGGSEMEGEREEGGEHEKKTEIGMINSMETMTCSVKMLVPLHYSVILVNVCRLYQTMQSG